MCLSNQEAGANDNTSGVAVVLSLAEALAGRSLPFSVRFIAFGAEELGLHGSRHYVASLTEAERARIKVMMNFDVVGSGVQLEVAGHQALTDLALKIAAELEIEAQPGSMPPGASSDHVPFQDAEIPALLLGREHGAGPIIYTRPLGAGNQVSINSNNLHALVEMVYSKQEDKYTLRLAK